MAKRSAAQRRLQNNRKYASARGTDERISKTLRRKAALTAPIDDLPSNLLRFEPKSPKRPPKTPLKPRNDSQARYITAIRSHRLTFGIGPAGTGKSYCAAALAAEALQERRIDQILVSRPAVEAGERLGFLPGDVEDKFAPYFDAFRDCLIERLGKGVFECAIKNDRIVAAPLAYLRGKTFNNAFVVLDEAQNCTRTQLKMFLTRIGEYCTIVVNGDITQSDIGNDSGLDDAVRRLRDLNGVYVHEFQRVDIVRSGLVRDIIDRYECP